MLKFDWRLIPFSGGRAGVKSRSYKEDALAVLAVAALIAALIFAVTGTVIYIRRRHS